MTMHRQSNMIKIWNWWAGEESAKAVVTSFITRVGADGGIVEAASCLESRIQSLKDQGLWNKASAIWLPHGYKENKLYAVKGGAGADLSFSRNGTRYRKGPTYVEEVPYNLLSMSTQFDNAFWTKDNITITTNNIVSPDGTLTADLITETTGVGVHNINNALAVVIGSDYVYSFYGKHNSGTRYVQIAGAGLQGSNEAPIFDLANGTVTVAGTSVVCKQADIIDVGDGWYRCWARISPVATSGFYISLSRTVQHSNDSYAGATSNSFYIWGTQARVGSVLTDYFNTTNRFNVPALDYTNNTCPALSLEPARTNLLLRSDEFDNANWVVTRTTVSANQVTGPDGLKAADRIIETSDVGLTHLIQQTISKSAAQITYAFSIKVKANGRDWIEVLARDSGANAVGQWFNITTLAAGVTALGGAGFSHVSGRVTADANGFSKIEFVFTSSASANLSIHLYTATGDGSNTHNGDGVSGFYVSEAQLEQGTYATSYIPTTTSTVSRITDSVPALLPKGTNQALQSQTLGTTWIPTNCAVVSDDTTAPDSTLTADRLRENSATDTFFTFRQEYTKAAKQILYTYSFHAKKSQRNWLRLALTDGTNSNGAHAWYNLDTGVVGSDALTGTSFSFVNKSIEDKGNGWYRCVLTALSDNTTGLRTYAVIEVADGPTIASHTGTTTDGLYLWGAQLEQGDEATPYVATTTSPVHNGTVIGQTEGTLYWEGSSFADSTAKHILVVSDGTLNNRIQIYFTTSNTIACFISNAGVTQAQIFNGGFSSGSNYKIALTYQNNKVAFFINGVKIGEDLTATIPACPNISFDSTGLSPFYGYGKTWVISPTAMSDTEAITLTTI